MRNKYHFSGIFFLLCLLTNPLASLQASEISRGDIMVMAHKGDWRTYPENSLPAITSALQKGADIIEIDVRKTSDGHLVLLHDTTVNRTTNGSGSISSMTLATAKNLRLREYWGGETSVTEYQIPTLSDTLDAVNSQALLFLDKGWSIRDEIYELVKAKGMVDHVVFEATGTPEEIVTFASKDPDIKVFYRLSDSSIGDEQTFRDLGYVPYIYQMNFDHYMDSHVQPDFITNVKRNGSKVLYNSLWYGQTPDATDEISHMDPESGWGKLIRYMGADIIQTDNLDDMINYLDSGTLPHLESIVVRADEFGHEGFGISYWDSSLQNERGASRPHEAADFCDNNGAVVLCFIRDNEWLKYQVVIEQAGIYEIYARVGARQQNAGQFFLEFDDQEVLHHVVGNTSGHELMIKQNVGEKYFEAGTHEFKFLVDGNAPNNNFNLHYFIFEAKQ